MKIEVWPYANDPERAEHCLRELVAIYNDAFGSNEQPFGERGNPGLIHIVTLEIDGQRGHA